MTFNPFDKHPTEKLTEADLQELLRRRVAEGYYVEYKSGFPSNDKIGQSIASFANTYGGWYVVGVEADKTNNAPVGINGFSLNDHPDPIARVRDVARSHIDPMPALFPQVIGLESGAVVFVVYIPDRQDKPLISKNGRIYRRSADSSEPVSEKDRHTIDRLYEEGRESRRRFEMFCRDERLYGSDDHRGWLKLFIQPYPDTLRKDIRLLRHVEELLERSHRPRPNSYFGDGVLSSALPLDTAIPTERSVLLRQAVAGHLTRNSLSIELFEDGRAKILMPLQFFPFTTYEAMEEGIKTEEVRNALQVFWDEDDDTAMTTSSVRFLDIGRTMGGLGSVIGFYSEWIGDRSAITEFRMKAIMDGVRHTMPLYDEATWATHVQKHGLPIHERDEISIPQNSQSWFSWDEGIGVPLLHWLYYVLVTALGLPVELHTRGFAQSLLDGSYQVLHEPSRETGEREVS